MTWRFLQQTQFDAWRNYTQDSEPLVTDEPAGNNPFNFAKNKVSANKMTESEQYQQARKVFVN